MTSEELEVIRAKIAGEPETSPARRLLTHIDEQRVERELLAIRSAVAHFRTHDGFTEAEAARLCDAILAKQPLTEESVKCHVCDGHRLVFTQGCLGGTMDRCDRCDGAGTITRYKVPPA